MQQQSPESHKEVGLKPRILLVEDDPDIVRIVQTYLQSAGYEVEVATDGRNGLFRALEAPPTLVVLDWLLPGMDGLDVLEHLREVQRTPVIMLTSKRQEADRVTGLEGGADDYLTKPFSPRELLARIKAVLRRAEPEDGERTLRRGLLLLDPPRRSAIVGDTALDLTTLEFNLLHLLASHPGRVFSRDELLARLKGDDYDGTDRVVDVHVYNLRRKLGVEPNVQALLQTIKGVGYRFAEVKGDA